MTSGYTHCACRDCMDTTVSSDERKPELCAECQEAGCLNYADKDPRTLDAWRWECQREDVYQDVIDADGSWVRSDYEPRSE